ncbi:MAG: hypothetical protein Q8P41_17975 [Pseudomonadota bacterium]|nr:hypothetical protein [Pseudomonadota bacterium]
MSKNAQPVPTGTQVLEGVLLVLLGQSVHVLVLVAAGIVLFGADYGAADQHADWLRKQELYDQLLNLPGITQALWVPALVWALVRQRKPIAAGVLVGLAVVLLLLNLGLRG